MSKLKLYIFASIFFSNFLYLQQIDEDIIKNLSAEEIAIVKELGNIRPTSEISTKPLEIKESTVKTVSKLGDINKKSSKKYGYDFFSSVPTSISAVGDLPLPNDYKISLNDQLTIILSGAKESIFDLNVKLDGTVLFPELGSISVVGETFGEVKEKFRNLINQSYIGVQIDVAIKNLSAKKITIVGAVNTPGTYLVNPFTTISSALAYSGGISDIGTLRKIRLIRNDETVFYFDLYKLLINGDRQDDITIEAGDVIIIDPANQFIKLSGQVKRPALYEVLDGETLDDLINFGLGFELNSNKENISILKLNKQLALIETYTEDNLDSSLLDVLEVDVNPFVNKGISKIKVSGAIKEPGLYSIIENKTLTELVKNLEFVDVYPWLAVLEQFDDENLLRTTTLFNLRDKSTFESVKLLPNSQIYFANLNEKSFNVSPKSQALINDYILTVNYKGNELSLPVFGKFKVKSFIDLLGLDMSDVDPLATYIRPLDDIIVIEDYNKMIFTSSKYHNLTFRSSVNSLITVKVSGAVNYPGSYTLNAGSSLADLYRQVGPFKEQAFLEGIVLQRETVKRRQIQSIENSEANLREAILLGVLESDSSAELEIINSISNPIDEDNLGRIAGNFSPKSDTTDDILLLDGDRLFIPDIPTTVSVIGEVLNPTAFILEDRMRINTAIENAGGLKDYADKSKIYVIKANGYIKPLARNIFLRSNELEVGDTIIVPRKIMVGNPVFDSLIPFTQVLSDFAFSAAAIETLSNN